MKACLDIYIFIGLFVPLLAKGGGGLGDPFGGGGGGGQSRVGDTSAPPLSTCFCPLSSGKLEDCPCSLQEVETLNNGSLHPLLTQLLESPYFRFFQVDFSRPCRHWPQGEGACSNPLCAIELCSEEQVPILDIKSQEERPEAPPPPGYFSTFLQTLHDVVPWIEPYYVSLFNLFGIQVGKSCAEKYSAFEDVDPVLPVEMKKAEQFCPLDIEGGEETCHYVDLVKNEEKYTGFSGRASNKVWEKIYNELCFKPEGENLLNSKTVQSMCLEKRAFYRVVSGLHASISIHICSRYLLEDEKPLFGKPAVWGKNYPEFSRRFSPSTTTSEGPERLKNVYFLYLLELRALVKAAPLLKSLSLSTGSPVEDENARMTLSKILELASAFPHQFNEDDLFKDEAKELIGSYREKISEIKDMMDCLGCERCKVWGKVQVTGLGTALKILFSPLDTLSLSKHELVALVNAFGRVSSSLEEIAHFKMAASTL